MKKSLSRSDLIDVLANKFRLENTISELAVKGILLKMSNALSKNERIEIRGFGSFEIRKRKERIARNPKTGADVKLSPQYNIHFKPGQPLREKINKYL